MSEVEYSRLEFWEVWNFMSITHGKCEFDERGIVNLKGYNDSGKSAMLSALRILLCNSDSSKQVNFIQDDASYFRVMAKFSDGVVILRDKYLNGQSLYEMYKDDVLVYTTKSPSGAMTKVTDVPEPIADYLGLITYEQTCINCRTRNDKRIGVDNTGSENYKMFNAVLKSEEIARAGILLNSDKNRLVNDINAVDNELSVKKTILSSKSDVSLGMIDWLKEHDLSLDDLEIASKELLQLNELYNSYADIQIFDEVSAIDAGQLVDLQALSSIKSAINRVEIAPAIDSIDIAQFDDLQEILNINSKLSAIAVAPQLTGIDNAQFEELLGVERLVVELEKTSVYPSVAEIDSSQLTDLSDICRMLENIASYNKALDDYDIKLESFNSELESLNAELEKAGVHLVTCPDCGRRFNPDETYLHD